MLRSAHFSVRALLALAAVAATAQQPRMVREGDRFRRDFYGTAPAARKLRINAHGPVTLQAGTGAAFSFRRCSSALPAASALLE